MKSVMFVCTGNICRSAMAHHYLQKRLYDLNREDEIAVSSCGTSVWYGERPTREGIAVMDEYNVDLRKHLPTSMYDADLENTDLILCMTEDHKESIIAAFPKYKDKVFTLREYVYGEDEPKKSISDPWGYEMQVYETCAKEIVECVDKLLEKI